ncbi:DUF4097 family beta strand repeat-containing protein [Actinoplanes sp. N902-109]|uniref:DUF4097 family beta strand repeat-containing protein n=1 Tax=Actinoplanes sp. (strain N902-109) TaxID=649831 RepID=UPI0003294E9F|nr:DUF4097 family beta strand repeat-containing protein [Actinoplanes sp. N902-109]AGL16859.1 lipoprotein [Actinoplanes sp. N902-109]
MTTTRALVGAGLVLVVAATGLAGCGGAKHTFSDTEPVKVTQIVLEGGNGKVTVDTADVGTTQLTRSSGRSKDPGKNYTIDGTVMHVKTGCGFHCSQDYDIQAPTGVRVTGELGSNKLTLTGVASADVSVDSGDVVITGASGAVRARTDSGAVKVSLTVPASVTAKSGSGNVTVTVPAGSYQVKMSSGSGGKLKSAIPDTGGAANRIDAETSSGNITVKAA